MDSFIQFKLYQFHTLIWLCASLAQSVEHETFNLRAAGSSPAGGFLETHTATFSSIIEYRNQMCLANNKGAMAEWSNATDLSSVLFGGAGSNPAGAIFKIRYSNHINQKPDF